MLDGTHYGITRKLPELSYDEAVARVTETLAEAGFGVLTEIDVKATFKKKLDVEHRPFVILGACNPPIARQALEAEAGFGLLMPCNVVVTVDDDGVTEVGAIDPRALLAVTGRDDLAELGDRIAGMLSGAIEGV